MKENSMTENGLERHHLDISISIKMTALRVKNQNDEIVKNGSSQITKENFISSEHLSFFRLDYTVLRHYEKNSQKKGSQRENDNR